MHSNSYLLFLSLLYAVESSNFEEAQSAILAGANVNQETEDERSLLYIAAKSGNMEIVELLVESGFEMYRRCSIELDIAAREGHLGIVKFLVKKGANVNVEIGDYSPPIIEAIKSRNEEMFKYFLSVTDQGICRQAIESSAQLASSKGNVSILKFLKDLDCLADVKAYEDRTLLMSASRVGQAESVKALLDWGFEVSARDVYGRTALMLATRCRTSGEVGRFTPAEPAIEVVRALYDAGADIFAKDNEGRSPIIHAAQFGLPEMIKFILELGANPNDRDNMGNGIIDYLKSNIMLSEQSLEDIITSL